MVAHLIMVLQKTDKSRGRQFTGRLPTRASAAERGGLSLIGQSFGERAPEMFGRFGGVIGVVTRRVAGHQDMQDMVEIIVPLRRVPSQPAPCPQITRLIAIVLEHEMNFAATYPPPYGLGNFAYYVGLALVENCMHGIKAQPVEMKLLQPVKGIVYEKITHGPAVGSGKIDCRAPWRFVGISEEIRGNRAQVIAFRAEMVADDIEKDSETAP